MTAETEVAGGVAACAEVSGERERVADSSLPPTTDTSLTSLSACRICQTTKSREELISPCNCKGTLGKVHLSCLERWLNLAGREYCELCRFHFTAQRKRRYGLCQSLRIWVGHPRHRMLIRSDLLVMAILSLITAGLCVICVMGMKYFVVEGHKFGVPTFYSRGAITLFLTVILLGYATTVYLMLKDHIAPWYRWWSRTMLIRISVVPNEVQQPHQV